MKYEGKIYGKVAGKYIQIHTTKDLNFSIVNAEKAKKYDNLKAKINEVLDEDELEFEFEEDRFAAIGRIVVSLLEND